MDKSDRKIRLAKIITFLLCIVVFGIVFKYTFDYLDIKDVKIEESIKATDLKSKSFTCSILQIDYDKEIVKLYDFNKKLAYEETYYISNATKYLDKDAHLLAKGSFKAGLIVDVTVTETTGMISKMQLSPKSWETTGVTNYKFDYENKVMEINGVKYVLDNDVVLIHDGTKLNYQDLIDANVILSIRGYDDIVLGIEVTEFLGKIKLKYNDNLKGSTVQIGNDKICDIEEVEDLYIKPGEYKIVITKKGIEDIVTKTVVEEYAKFLKVRDREKENLEQKNAIYQRIINFKDDVGESNKQDINSLKNSMFILASEYEKLVKDPTGKNIDLSVRSLYNASEIFASSYPSFIEKFTAQDIIKSLSISNAMFMDNTNDYEFVKNLALVKEFTSRSCKYLQNFMGTNNIKVKFEKENEQDIKVTIEADYNANNKQELVLFFEYLKQIYNTNSVLLHHEIYSEGDLKVSLTL